MLKRPYYLVLGLVVVVTLVILNLPEKTAARLKLGIGSLFVAPFWVADTSKQVAGKAGDALLPRAELLRQNEALRRQNQELRFQSAQAEGMARENDRLRQLLGWPQQKRWKLKLASVVLREPSNLW